MTTGTYIAICGTIHIDNVVTIGYKSGTGSMITEGDTQVLDSLLEKVYRESRHDFRDYKQGTVVRRLERRLRATGVKTYLEYMQFLDTHSEEYRRLAEYLTITVSGFFRGMYTFQQIAKLVLPELISYKRGEWEQSLSIWSVACARGEEPYSIAILLADFLRNERGNFDISIYATDVNRRILREAKMGVYPRKHVENLPRGFLEDYFTCGDEGCEVIAEIRRRVNFSYFDLVSNKTSPFMNLDCIFCCNVLIYFKRHLQERVLDMLYSSLGSPGYLILGEAETPTSSLCGKLECLDARAKIYKKK